MLWHIGNTTVRTPYRLRLALIALSQSKLRGNLKGKKQEGEFAELLRDNDVLNIKRDSGFEDLGRKWRSALSQLGFIKHPKAIIDSNGADQNLEYDITQNGYRMIRAEEVAAQQECFLRSLVSYRVPSKAETTYKCDQFSPLRFVLDILVRLESLSEGKISFEEMGNFVLRSTPKDDIDSIVSGIISFREDKDKAVSKKVFSRNYLSALLQKEYPRASQKILNTKKHTIRDYSDVNFRYLKSTGLFVSKGNGIAISPQKKDLVSDILKTPFVAIDNDQYFTELWHGAKLPTDNVPFAKKTVQTLQEELKKRGMLIRKKSLVSLGIDELNSLRYGLETELSQIDEEEYAREQSSKWGEIIEYMEDLQKARPQLIPAGDAPIYLEWVIWRAFLAINSLVNKPWESRLFKMDQDFLPVSNAPAGKPDLVFEFDDFVLVVEVTLSASSRQEAMEGEPVRRHIADITEKYQDKEVFGLFIARTVDSNTAETLRMGTWYKKDDTKIALRIVPVRLDLFCQLLRKRSSSKKKLKPDEIKALLMRCLMDSNSDAPTWKAKIDKLVST